MSVSTTEWITLREYAKHKCVNPSTITYAIKVGRIPESSIRFGELGKDGKPKHIHINKYEADIAWKKTNNTIHNKGRNSTENQNVPRGTKKIKDTITSEDTPEITNQNVISFSEAQRRKEVAKSGKAQLEFLALQGKLVEKDVVYRQLFEGGQQLRNSMMAIPDRVTAEISSVGGNQNEIRRILTEAIASGLESLIDLNNLKMG